MDTAIHSIEKSEYARFGRYLHEQHFLGILLVAFLIHAAAIFIYYLMPQPPVQEIPVRVLSVKLGGSKASGITSSDVNRLFAQRRMVQKTQPDASIAATPTESVVKVEPKAEPEVKPEVKKALPPKPVKQKVAQKKPLAKKAAKQKPVVKKQPPKVAEPVIKRAAPKTVATPPAKTPAISGNNGPTILRTNTPSDTLPIATQEPLKRYIRETEMAASPLEAIGSELGNSLADSAAIQTRYTQEISLWIDKHKVYPAAARARGEGGKVVLRIRINRQGRIMRYMLEKSSGSDAIDRAITQMVDAANPLPAVPTNYPDSKSYLEFLIPINFIP